MTPYEVNLLQRIESFLAARAFTADDTSANRYAMVMEQIQGTVALLTSVYGPGSRQERVLVGAFDKSNKDEGLPSHNIPKDMPPVVRGTLLALKGDVEAGLVGSAERRGEGTVLSDMLGLAKEANGLEGDGHKNVAAVLAAAAFEDVLRRMGATFAGVDGRPDLQDVVTALKRKDVIKGPSVSVAVGYLKFRNDALHADWKNIDRASISGVISFVEGLVLQNFG